jgi:CheY-like chemotaxis protein
MDGIEATQRIRQDFPAEMQPRIIAVTANAMQGDREECLAAGMDDYISKPFEIQELVGALKKVKPSTTVRRGDAPANAVERGDAPANAVERGDAPANAVERGDAPAEAEDRTQKNEEHVEVPNPPNPNTTPHRPILDPASIKRLQTTLGEQAATLLPTLIENFFEDAIQLQERARRAFEQGEAKELQRSAHTLKSNARNFGAIMLAETCQEVEYRAKIGELTGIKNLVSRIELQYKKTREALETLLEDI